VDRAGIAKIRIEFRDSRNGCAASRLLRGDGKTVLVGSDRLFDSAGGIVFETDV
jgi:hypothetical protein